MPSDTVTLALDGNVPLPLYARAMGGLERLVAALSKEVAGEADIRWLISDLQPGSAIATIRGESREVDGVERVVVAYGVTGEALQTNSPVPYSERVGREARSIIGLLDGEITSVRFETPESDWTIYSHTMPKRSPKSRLAAHGAIRGRIQTLSNRGSLRFTLFDTLEDRAISCYLQDGQRELIRGVWGQRAIVAGWVSRDSVSGRPISIRRVNRIEPLTDVPPGSYEHARGVLPVGVGSLSPEEAIRRVRDA